MDLTVKKSNHSEKARLGALGENLVVANLMQHGWDAFNANCTIKNFKAIDIVCINGDLCDKNSPYRPKVAFVQVKSSYQTNIPIGFSVGDCLDKEILRKKVIGAYVFVYAKKICENKYEFSYYVISREDFIELAYQSHKWYVEGYTRTSKGEPLNSEERLNGIKLSSPAGFKISWLKGESEKATGNRIAFNNPLKGISCEDKWENIWKDCEL